MQLKCSGGEKKQILGLEYNGILFVGLLFQFVNLDIVISLHGKGVVEWNVEKYGRVLILCGRDHTFMTIWNPKDTSFSMELKRYVGCFLKKKFL